MPGHGARWAGGGAGLEPLNQRTVCPCVSLSPPRRGCWCSRHPSWGAAGRAACGVLEGGSCSQHPGRGRAGGRGLARGPFHTPHTPRGRHRERGLCGWKEAHSLPGKCRLSTSARPSTPPHPITGWKPQGPLKVREHQCGRGQALSSAGTLGVTLQSGPSSWVGGGCVPPPGQPASCHPRGSVRGDTEGCHPARSLVRLSQTSLWFLGTPQRPKHHPFRHCPHLLIPSAGQAGQPGRLWLPPKEVPSAPLTSSQGRTAPSFLPPSSALGPGL